FSITHLVDDPAAVLAAANLMLLGAPPRPSRRPGTAKPSPAGKIRVGYLSSDFNQHPVGFLLTDLIDLHDRS
ncbi:hypothetical protein, partial [Acinetobacter baumannii]|uniref:hypothetical protein n=1 Tax=Acinetobacter baumannii TaxID=470 RepID=UPI001C093DC8